jgi:hypothetical protein
MEPGHGIEVVVEAIDLVLPIALDESRVIGVDVVDPGGDVELENVGIETFTLDPQMREHQDRENMIADRAPIQAVGSGILEYKDDFGDGQGGSPAGL